MVFVSVNNFQTDSGENLLSIDSLFKLMLTYREQTG